MSEEIQWVARPIPYNIFFQARDGEGGPLNDLHDMTFTFERVYPDDLLYTPRLHPELREAIEEMIEYILYGRDRYAIAAATKVQAFLSHIPEEK